MAGALGQAMDVLSDSKETRLGLSQLRQSIVRAIGLRVSRGLSPTLEELSHQIRVYGKASGVERSLALYWRQKLPGPRKVRIPDAAERPAQSRAPILVEEAKMGCKTSIGLDRDSMSG